ncbi:uncharacterized protein LOC120353807 [Nilaparvata lugens]|uniref:uncharacterized protein LOC120353807 n=1 Tax=Nilaparvata lugens TaxID=108931 RepID=UPI00193EB978|nr:uncharacterized protein LOC120353807 [Nilaparvata lugens]
MDKFMIIISVSLLILIVAANAKEDRIASEEPVKDALGAVDGFESKVWSPRLRRNVNDASSDHSVKVGEKMFSMIKNIPMTPQAHAKLILGIVIYLLNKLLSI